MVNDNENNEGSAPRRKGLFGTRRARSDSAPASSGTPATGSPADPGSPHPESAHTDVDHTAAARAGAGGADDLGFHDLDPSTGSAEAEAALEAVPAEIVGLEPMVTPEVAERPAPLLSSVSLLFQAPDIAAYAPRLPLEDPSVDDDRQGGRADESTTVRRRSRRRSGEEDQDPSETPPNTVVKVRSPRPVAEPSTEPQRIKGSTRLEAKKQRRRDGRDAGRRRPVISEAEFIARRESVERMMIVRSKYGRIQIGVLEDGVLAEHYVAKAQEASLIGNVYLGRVQNVLPSMEAAFVDIGRGRNAVLYSGEVDWEAAAEGTTGHQARRIELALKPGDRVLVQVTKDPVGHKGARLTSQVSLPGRYLVYVPNGSMSGISRKLPDTERARLKKVLKEVLPANVGVIVRTAAEGATDEQLALDVARLTAQWARISEILETVQAPALLHSEPDLLVKIVRDVFNEDFLKLVIEGDDAEETITAYLRQVAPDLIDRVERYEGTSDSFDEFRISEQIEKALDRKVWLPSGGSLVMDRTEAMTVIDVNTGKFVGSGGNLEETVTKNNIEAAEEIVRQLRLRDIGGIIVVDFIDMVLESNRDLVLRRLVECLSRDRTKHQVAEVTSLGLVQMTRKKLGLGLIESFSENCEVCAGRGIIVRHDPDNKHRQTPQPEVPRRGRKGGNTQASTPSSTPKAGTGTHAITDDVRNALAKIATSTISQIVPDAAAAAAPTETVGAAGSVAPGLDLPSAQDAPHQADASETVGVADTVDAVDAAVASDDSAAPAGSRRDSGRRGSGRGDSRRRDSGRQDSGRDDSGRQDAGRDDSGRQDAGRQDSGRQDSGRQDSGRRRAPVEETPAEVAVAAPVAVPVHDDEPAVSPVLSLPDSGSKVTQSTGPRRARGRGRRVTEVAPIPADAAGSGFLQAGPVVAPTAAPVAAPAAAPTGAETGGVAILDIPVARHERPSRAIPTEVAEQILDSVLDALPEPRPAGQGRARTSRRASSQGTVTAAVDDTQQ
jgi:ribonuclease E